MEEMKNIHFEEVLDSVSTYFGFSKDIIMGRKRNRPYVRAREILCFIMNRIHHQRWSYLLLADITGRSSHASIIHIVKNAENQLKMGNNSYIGDMYNILYKLDDQYLIDRFIKVLREYDKNNDNLRVQKFR